MANARDYTGQQCGEGSILSNAAGVRLEECRGIEPTRDLYLPERWVRVTGKFGKTRDVPLPAALVPVSEQQLAADGQLWKQNPQRLREVLSEACGERKNKKG
jgi:site-specific recombinase XerC